MPDVAISYWTTGDPHVASLLGMNVVGVGDPHVAIAPRDERCGGWRSPRRYAPRDDVVCILSPRRFAPRAERRIHSS